MNDQPKIQPTAADDTARVLDRMLDPQTSPEDRAFFKQTYNEMKATNALIYYRVARANMAPELPVIEKKGRIAFEGKGGSRNTPYERWEDVVEVLTPVLSRHGFAIEFKVFDEPPHAPAGRIKVRAILGHICGHHEETEMSAPADNTGQKNAIQQIKSTISYLKRTTAGLLLNFVARGDDDDGATGGQPTITDEQIKAIEERIASAGADRDRFCALYKIKQVGELPSSKYDEAMTKLALFAAQQKQEKRKADAAKGGGK